MSDRKNEQTVRIPIRARMMKDSAGRYVVDEAHSEYADVPVEELARLVVRAMEARRE